MTELAVLDAVTHRFGDVLALDEATLRIPSGQILGLLGPNGAGKSTALGLLRGLRRPTSGTVRLFGRDPRDARARARLGCTPQESALPASLTVREVIEFVGAHFVDRTGVDELAEAFDLGELLKRQTGALSGGQQRRVSVALAFVGRPRLVLLDEPTTGLDLDARESLWARIRSQHEAGATIVVTSHYLAEIEALAQRVVVLDRGRVIADDDLAGILARSSDRIVQVRTADPDAVIRLAADLDAVTGERDGEGRIALTLRVADSDALVRDLVVAGLDFADLAVRPASLDEAFRALTAGDGHPTTDQRATAEARA